jgi:hypothetical protein
VGALVAPRALSFGMRLAAYDPYVSRDRARAAVLGAGRDIGARLVETAMATDTAGDGWLGHGLTLQQFALCVVDLQG